MVRESGPTDEADEARTDALAIAKSTWTCLCMFITWLYSPTSNQAYAKLILTGRRAGWLSTCFSLHFLRHPALVLLYEQQQIANENFMSR